MSAPNVAAALEPRPQAQPTCPSHPDQQAVGTCARCGRFVCLSCVRDDRICASCVQVVVAAVPSSAGRASWAVRFLGLHAVTDLAAVAVAVFALATARSADATTVRAVLDGIIAIPTLVAVIGAGIAFLRWLHLAVRQANALGIDVGATPGWAVGWWFVPIANLWKPYNVVRSLVSQLGGESAVAAARLGLWWGMWIVGNILSQVEARLALRGGLEGDVPLEAYGVGIFSSLLSAAGAWLRIGVVRATQKMIEARRQGA